MKKEKTTTKIGKIAGIVFGIMVLCLLEMMIPKESKAATLFDGAIEWKPYKIMMVQKNAVYKFTFDKKQEVCFHFDGVDGDDKESNVYGDWYDGNGLSYSGPDMNVDEKYVRSHTFLAGTYYYRVSNISHDDKVGLPRMWYYVSAPSSKTAVLDNIAGTPFEQAESWPAMQLYNQGDDLKYLKVQLNEPMKITLKCDRCERWDLYGSNGIPYDNEANLQPGTYFLRVYGETENLYYVLTNPDQATGVTLSRSSATLSVGQTLKLNYALSPAKCVDTVTWSSGNTSVATVDEKGRVKAVGVGKCLIIATASSKKISRLHDNG